MSCLLPRTVAPGRGQRREPRGFRRQVESHTRTGRIPGKTGKKTELGNPELEGYFQVPDSASGWQRRKGGGGGTERRDTERKGGGMGRGTGSRGGAAERRRGRKREGGRGRKAEVRTPALRRLTDHGDRLGLALVTLPIYWHLLP